MLETLKQKINNLIESLLKRPLGRDSAEREIEEKNGGSLSQCIHFCQVVNYPVSSYNVPGQFSVYWGTIIIYSGQIKVDVCRYDIDLDNCCCFTKSTINNNILTS